MTLSEQISGWIAERVQEAKAEGIVLGLSGGLDSSVIAVLCANAYSQAQLFAGVGIEFPAHLELEVR